MVPRKTAWAAIYRSEDRVIVISDALRGLLSNPSKAVDQSDEWGKGFAILILTFMLIYQYRQQIFCRTQNWLSAQLIPTRFHVICDGCCCKIFKNLVHYKYYNKILFIKLSGSKFSWESSVKSNRHWAFSLWPWG